MKSQQPVTRPARSYRSWIAGIVLCAACILFITSHIYVRWSSFQFGNRRSITINTGLWRRNMYFRGRLIETKIDCTRERGSCTRLIIARIFLILACITSGIGGICLCILPTLKNNYKSIIYIGGFCLAFLSFVYGTIGSLFGISWIRQFEIDNINITAIYALIGSFLSLASATCTFFINSNEST